MTPGAASQRHNVALDILASRSYLIAESGVEIEERMQTLASDMNAVLSDQRSLRKAYAVA